ncbi:MAG: LacI family DNA-binding transcriptional regulator [Hespellia sp.]|nr:LacI family DNA-binding transcriptional regulator [Hespellia sp.]
MTNADIAQKLGISVTAVSLALNNKPGVSDKTREKVRVLKSGDFHQNYMQQNFTIQFIVHKKHGEIIDDKPFFNNLIGTIQQEAMFHSYQLNIIHYSNEMNLEDFVKSISLSNIVGTIILATEMTEDDLAIYNLLSQPLVLLDASFDLSDFDSVTINNKDAVFQAVAYAYNLGHKSIGYLRSSVSISNFDHRYDGYRSALRHFELEDYYRPCFYLHCSINQSYEDMKQILSSEDIVLPSIFLCDLDYIALGASKALIETGYHIPEDISIIGFDDISASQVFQPPLTTIHVNRDDIGKIAVQVLHERIQNPMQAHITTQISAYIVPRSSVSSL